MKKYFEVVAVVMLYTVLVSIPMRLYGWEWEEPRWVPQGAVKGTIYFSEDVDWEFVGKGTIHYSEGKDMNLVGVKLEKDLWDGGYSAWMRGPDQVTAIKHPDPNVPGVIKNWMQRNKVNWAIIPLNYGGRYIDEFAVIRYNYTNFPDTDEYRNRTDAYTTLCYDVTM
jgi:hypothetical protein